MILSSQNSLNNYIYVYIWAKSFIYYFDKVELRKRFQDGLSLTLLLLTPTMFLLSLGTLSIV